MATPPAWDSSLCMAHWERPELQNEPDPDGYVIYVDGRWVTICDWQHKP